MLKKIKEYFTHKLLSGSKIPYIILIFFLIVLTVNIIYILIASKNWSGVAVTNSYNKGLNYNQTIKIAKEQEKLGWKLKYEYIPQIYNTTKGKFRFLLYDKNDNRITDASIYVVFQRPDNNNITQSLNLSFNKNSDAYEDVIDFSIAGKWHANITITRKDDTYRLKKKFIIK